jgi:hypothetical protein
MSIVLLGSTSGSVTLQEPAVAGTTTLDLPATSGTVVVGSSAVSATGQIPFSTNGTTYTPTAKIVSGTAVASTSGTSIDFTSIPSWAKKITVMFNGVSTSGTSDALLRIGSGSITTSGYTSIGGSYWTGASASAAVTSGIALSYTGLTYAAGAYTGAITLNLLNSSTNLWVASGSLSSTGGTVTFSSAVVGSLALAGALDRVRITTVNGTDTFDAGSINILYE